ncbi:hypothetical protein MnTg02_02466 [bacterium MnTg02]|nr:hypothetical protein MnTg02_02466 [bacterium MnTg02]
MSKGTTPVGFEEQKAAQISAFFAAKNGGSIEKLKLIKLIYLSEREFVSQHGHPMLFDELYSLPHGPICSSALDGINQNLTNDVWKVNISKEQKNDIETKLTADTENFDHISKAEYAVLCSIWESFGFMTSNQLRNYTHKNCPEYTEVEKGKRMPISYRDLFEALDFDDPENSEDRIMDTRRAHNVLSY